MHIAQKVREQDGRESLDDSSLLWPYLYHFYIILGSAPTVGGGGGYFRNTELKTKLHEEDW